MRNYTPQKYKDAIGFMADNSNDEFEIIKRVESLGSKTIVDLGAGYGRVLEFFSENAKNVIAIEINPEMYKGLKEESVRFSNVKVLNEDITKLSKFITNRKNLVFLLLQNTLGTIEGDDKKVLKEIKKFSGDNNSVIVSLFRQEALRDFGVNLYKKTKKIVGEIDLDKTDFDKGLFVSKTGYVSRWRTDEEIEEIKSFFGGRILHEVSSEWYYILHINL